VDGLRDEGDDGRREERGRGDAAMTGDVGGSCRLIRPTFWASFWRRSLDEPLSADCTRGVIVHDSASLWLRR
jgi:hypothetical protein